jgi:hypothetical protein
MTEEGYLLGFDLRACARDYVEDEWSEERRETYLLKRDVEWPLSVDSIVWPSLFHFTSRLADYRPVESVQVEPATPRQTVLRLWDDSATMEAYYAKAVTNHCFVRVAIEVWEKPSVLGGSTLDPFTDLPARHASPEWPAIGFDVADSDFISGLMNCGYIEHDQIELSRWTNALNQFGLFRDLEGAIGFRSVIEKRVPDHVPFFAFRLLADLNGMM